MINLTIGEDGIATLCWDMPGRSQNVLNEASCTALCALIGQVANDAAVKGILMASVKPDFIAGSARKPGKAITTIRTAAKSACGRAWRNWWSAW